MADQKDTKKEEETVEQEMSELDKALEESKKNLEGWKRAQADYQNLLRENERREKEMKEYLIASVMTDVLPVYTNFQEAMKFVPEDQKDVDWIKGVSYIKNQLEEFLNQNGVSEMDVINKDFDPNLCEAVGEEESEEHEAGKVMKVLSSGFIMGEKVLIPAKVIISK